MSQVIVYQNTDAPNVCVCYPSGEMSIEAVMAKDCPAGSLIVDDSTLPQDHAYFDAWRLVNGVVVVDEEAAKQIAINNLDVWARQEYLQRAADEAIGVQSTVIDARFTATGDDFSTVIENGRQKIAAATNTAQMTAIVVETKEEAKTAPLE